MQHLAVGKRGSFELWLRTGHRSCPDIAKTLECKFNPWHDPDDGRFTFAGSGRHYGGSAGRDSQQAARSARRKAGPLRVDVPGLPSDQSTRGFGGGGGAGSWPPHSRTTRRQPGLLGPSPSRPAAVRQNSVQRELSGLDGQARATLPFKRVAKTVIRHGYRFDIDHLGRTWKVEGTITEDPLQRRSKQSQLQAGGKYRLRTDDGGHFNRPEIQGADGSLQPLCTRCRIQPQNLCENGKSMGKRASKGGEGHRKDRACLQRSIASTGKSEHLVHDRK